MGKRWEKSGIIVKSEGGIRARSGFATNWEEVVFFFFP